MKKWIIAGVLVLGLLVLIMSTREGGKPVDVVTVQRGDIQSWVEEQAKTTLPEIHHVTMPLSGRIEAIELEEGDAVKQGQVVAQMDAADLKTELTRAKSDLEIIESRIRVNRFDKLEKTALQEADKWIETVHNAVLASKKTMEASQARLDYAKWWVDRVEALTETESASEQKLKEARTDYVEAQVERQNDEFIYYSMLTFYSVAQMTPEYIDEWLERKHLTRDTLEKEQEGARAALERAQRDLGRASITSAIDGVVLERFEKSQKFLPAGAPLLDIGNLSEMEVTAEVLSDEAVQLRTGDRVDILGPAIGENPITGHVKRIKPAGFTKLSSLGVEEQRVEVIISMDSQSLQSLLESDRPLGVEYRVRVRIYTDSKRDVLMVPRTALFRGTGNQWQTFMVDEGKARLANVSVGLINDRHAEILQGLEEDKRVIIAPDSSLKDGADITITSK